MPYTNTTLAQALTALSIRLSDSDNTYWTVAEKTAYIVEGLRTWQAFTSSYRNRQTFNTVANISFYDLTSLLPAGVFDYNITDRRQISVILYHILENQLTGGFGWGGTDQFSLPQIVGALTRRRNQFLGDTGCVVHREVVNFVPTPSGRVDLDEKVIDIRRADWLDGSTPQVASTLWREDEFSINAYKPGWRQDPTDPPLVYSVSLTPPVSLQLAPIIANVGQVGLCTVRSDVDLDVNTGVLLRVPDDLAWGVKWGAMADLLGSDGPGRDVERAAYCEGRYKQAVELARLNPSILETDIQDIPINSDSITEMDMYKPNWQNDSGQPEVMGMAGRNLLAFGDTPDASYGVGLDMIPNMPTPSLLTDFLQVGRDAIDTILDYAQHLASFKMGGADFSMTAHLYVNFIKQAGLVNARIRQASFYNDALRQPALKQSAVVPRLDIPRSAEYENKITTPSSN